MLLTLLVQCSFWVGKRTGKRLQHNQQLLESISCWYHTKGFKNYFVCLRWFCYFWPSQKHNMIHFLGFSSESKIMTCCRLCDTWKTCLPSARWRSLVYEVLQLQEGLCQVNDVDCKTALPSFRLIGPPRGQAPSFEALRSFKVGKTFKQLATRVVE